jgi:hypothetical protein
MELEMTALEEEQMKQLKLEIKRKMTPLQWELYELEVFEGLGGVLDDKLDAAYRAGVQAGLESVESERGEFRDGEADRNSFEHPEQAFRRGYQQGAISVLDPLRRTGLLTGRVLRAVERFIFGEIFNWRYAKRRRLQRSISKDRPPRLEM